MFLVGECDQLAVPSYGVLHTLTSIASATSKASAASSQFIGSTARWMNPYFRSQQAFNLTLPNVEGCPSFLRPKIYDEVAAARRLNIGGILVEDGLIIEVPEPHLAIWILDLRIVRRYLVSSGVVSIGHDVLDQVEQGK